MRDETKDGKRTMEKKASNEIDRRARDSEHWNDQSRHARRQLGRKKEGWMNVNKMHDWDQLQNG